MSPPRLVMVLPELLMMAFAVSVEPLATLTPVAAVEEFVSVPDVVRLPPVRLMLAVLLLLIAVRPEKAPACRTSDAPLLLFKTSLAARLPVPVKVPPLLVIGPLMVPAAFTAALLVTP